MLSVVCLAPLAAGTDEAPAALSAGSPAPDFALTPLRFYHFRLDEREITRGNAWELYRPVRVSDFRGKRPLVLIFGSDTSVSDEELATWHAQAVRVGEQVQFLFVYVSPPDEVSASALERVRNANEFAARRGLEIPCLVDDPRDSAHARYAAAPKRVFLIGTDGKLAFVGAANSGTIDDETLDALGNHPSNF